MSTKHIFVTGGVVSSLGKGVTAAALAFLLRRRGYRVAMQKLDPYLNVDPGTMSPYQHGEVFVTDDGAETDLDLGHYERIAGVTCSKASNYTSGKIYGAVIARERRGDYLGATVQVIPHITDEIRRAMGALHAPDVDIAITEIGGTAGDIESLPFLEAARQFRLACAPGDCIFIHLTYVPYLKAAKELKTKPSQQSVGVLRNIGIQPDVLVCRAERHLGPEHLRKLAVFCNVPEQCVIEELDVRHAIYEVPIKLAQHRLDEQTLRCLRLEPRPLDLRDYRHWLAGALRPTRPVTIALVGKYIRHQDAYKSIYEALSHAAMAHHAKLEILRVEAEELERGDPAAILSRADGILVPGGFGRRGLLGMFRAVTHARVSGTPFFGICLGMQCAVIACARDLLGWADADSIEFAPDTTHPVIALMEEQKAIHGLGGTMRLGAYACRLAPDSRAAALYGATEISERHRHRYEFNPAFRAPLEGAGLRVTGQNPETGLAEVVELPGHAFFIGCQFHPEFKSRPRAPHPLFAGFVAAALAHRETPERINHA